MNNHRRRLLAMIGRVLDSIHREMEDLAAEESSGKLESQATRNERVHGWQSGIRSVSRILRQVLADEKAAAKNTRDSLLREEKDRAAAEIDACLKGMTELSTLEDTGRFNEMWWTKYDNMIKNLQEAAKK